MRDVISMSATELREKYTTTYNSWKNRKSIANPQGNWSSEFESFRDFLRHMGPCPTKGYTLDRIDNRNPHYGPGLCRWANKKEQATNRSSTNFVNIGGEMLSVSEASRQTGKSRASIAQNALERYAQFGRDPRTYKPWPHREDEAIFNEYERRYLLSGGAENCDRYRYLIAFCKGRIRELSAKSYLVVDENGDQYEEGVDQIQRQKWQSHLERAQTEYPLWLEAVKIYNALKFERDQNRWSWSAKPKDDFDDFLK